MDEQTTVNEQQWADERWELLRNINDLTDRPMIVLAIVWLVLLILDFTTGLDPFLQTVGNIIWGLFVLDFAIEFIIAPRKLEYLRHNWLTAISLVIPALRVLRIFRVARVLQAARATRTLNLVRVVSSMNRGTRAIQSILGRQGVTVLIVITIIVLLAGAAGIWAFENPGALRQDRVDVQAIPVLDSFGDAIWWTAMILTTLGSEYWPQTAEGRILCFLLSFYALGVFSYITATVASHFIGGDKRKAADDAASAGAQMRELREELAALREQLRALTPHQPDQKHGDA